MTNAPAQGSPTKRFAQIVKAAERIKTFHKTAEQCRDEADFIIRLARDAMVEAVQEK